MRINYENITLEMIELYEQDYEIICNADLKCVEIYVK